MSFLPVESNPVGSPLEPNSPSAMSGTQSLGTAIPQLKSPAPLILPTFEPTIIPLQPTSPSTILFSPLLNGPTSLEPQIDQSSTSSTPLGTLDPDAPLVGSDVFTSTPRSTSNFNLIETTYTSGIFVADSTGRLGVDYLFDGGGYEGQLGIFSLAGMELFAPGSPEFIREAAQRVLSNSDAGYVLIDDLQEGARFNGMLGEIDRNAGDYLGVKSFQVAPNGTYALMLVPNGRVDEVVQNPNISDYERPLFSLVTANPNEAFHIGQLADVVGDGTTFVFEDLRMDQNSDRDYNDLVFRVQGATGYAALMDDVIAPDKTWKHSVLGQQVLTYVQDFKDATKPIPGNPTYPALPIPQMPLPTIPVTPVDQGGNSIVNPSHSIQPEPPSRPNPGGALQYAPTPIQASPITDVIDQVSPNDPIDTYQVSSQQLAGTEISILTGKTSVTVLDNQGQVLTQQILDKGTHTLTLPEEIAGEVVVQVGTLENTNATYVLSGFESKAEEPYNVAVEFGEGISNSQKAIIQAAAQSIEGLISQGLPSAIVDGKIIDDINFKISAVDLDGVDGTLAETKIDFMRYGSLLPAQSITRLDRADLNNLEKTGQLFSVVQHEMLHGLGFGNLWEAKGLVEYTKTPFSRYVGEQAVAAFQELGGATDSIPLELEGDGSADLHWNESLFQDELMTRNLNFQSVSESKNSQPSLPQNFAPISSVTLASLADLGYQVNLNQSSPNWHLLGNTVASNVEENPLATELLADSVAMEEVKQAFEFLAASPYVSASGDDISIVIPPVDSSTIAPTNWAHAERFDVNGEYYDWRETTIQWGDTVSQYVLDTMARHSSQDTRTPLQKANDPRYWQFIVDRNRAFGVENPHVIYAGRRIFLPVWNENYAWEQEQERLRREEELRKQQEEEKKERDRQEEAYRQAGSGGLEWFLAKPLPDFGRVAPFESNVRDVVGNLVPDDYFRFTLDRPGWVTVYLEDLLADADLYLYDSRDRLMGQANRSGLTDEKIIMNLTPGTYLVRVNSPAGVTTDYNLKVRFDGLPTRTQIGNGGKKATFSDPRIEGIFVNAVNKFSAEQWAAAQPQINNLEAEKRQKQQEVDALLQQAIAQQKAKIYGELDNIRNGARQNISNKANDIKNGVNWVADQAKNIVNSAIPGWVMDGLNKVGLGDQVRNAQNNLKDKIDEAKNWLNSQVDWARDRINDLIWQFNEMVKNAYVTGGEINQAIDNAANWLKGKTDELVNWLNGKVDEVKGKILGAMQWTRDIRTPDWAKRWPLNLPDWNLYDNVVVGIVNDVAGGIQDTVRSIGDGFKQVVNGVTPLVQGAVAIIVDAIFGDKTGKLYNEINGINQKIANIVNGVKNTIAQGTEAIKSIVRQIENLLSNPEERRRVLDALFRHGYQTVEEAHRFIAEELPKVRDQIAEEVKQAFEKAKKAFADLVRRTLDSLLPGTTEKAINLNGGVGVETDAIIAGGILKGGTEYQLSRELENGKPFYFTSIKPSVGIEVGVGVGSPIEAFVGAGIQTGNVKASGQLINLQAKAGVSIQPNFDIEVKYKFDRNNDEDMIKLGVFTFKELPSPFDAVDPILQSVISQNLYSVQPTLSGTFLAEAISPWAQGEISYTPSLQTGIKRNEFGGFNQTSTIEAGLDVQGGWSSGAALSSALGLNTKGKVSFSLESSQGELQEVSMVAEVPSFAANQLESLVGKSLQSKIDAINSTIDSKGQAISMVKVETKIRNISQLINSGSKAIQDIFQLAQVNNLGEFTGDLVNTLATIFSFFNDFRNSTEVQTKAIAEQIISIEGEGKVFLGGEFNLSLGSTETFVL